MLSSLLGARSVALAGGSGASGADSLGELADEGWWEARASAAGTINTSRWLPPIPPEGKGL